MFDTAPEEKGHDEFSLQSILQSHRFFFFFKLTWSQRQDSVAPAPLENTNSGLRPGSLVV